MATIDDTKIKSNAESVKKYTVDGMTVERHDLEDQIKADVYLSAKAHAQGTGLGIKLNKIKPPGAI